MNRRDFLATSAGTAMFATPGRALWLTVKRSNSGLSKAGLQSRQTGVESVKIASIDLLQSGKNFFVRTRSQEGVEGIVLTKDMEDLSPSSNGA
jgi:hypothetical protein